MVRLSKKCDNGKRIGLPMAKVSIDDEGYYRFRRAQLRRQEFGQLRLWRRMMKEDG